jgi:lysophospholipase L1-like esterase
VNDYFNIVDQPDYDPDRDGAARLMALVDRIQELRPGTEVVVSTLLPVDFDDGFADGFNQALAPLVAQREGVALIDANRAEIPDGAFIDGLHVDDRGADIVAAAMADELVPLLEAWQQAS